MDLEVAKNIVKLLGVTDDQFEKLGTAELPVESVLNNFKGKVIESEALANEKIKAEIDKAHKTGQLAFKGTLDAILGDESTREWWVKNKDAYQDDSERYKAYLEHLKVLNGQRVEIERAKASKDAKEWMDTAESQRKQLEELIAQKTKLEAEDMPNLRTEFESKIKELQLETMVWRDYVTAGVDFKNDTKMKQDFSTYKSILFNSYDFRSSLDGSSLILFKKGTSDMAVNEAGKPISLKAAIEAIAESRGERIKSNPTEGGGRQKEVLTPEEQKKIDRSNRYKGTVGLT